MKILPLFKSHFSIGRSILTLEKEGASSKTSPDSIFDIAKEYQLPNIFLIENNMSGFLEAFKNAEESKTKLRFGLRLTTVSDIQEKTENSLLGEHKIIILLKKYEGYKNLIKLYSCAATTGFYYEPRIDYATLKLHWDNNLLSLAIPFYDSYIFQNVLTFSQIVPDFNFTKPIYYIENNNLPFDNIVTQAIEKYVKKDSLPTILTKTIYYKNKRDFKTYLTNRCINNKSTLAEPRFDHMSSDKFCIESWLESEKSV